MARVLVTGATGFVGRTLCEVLQRAGYRVRAALRNQGDAPIGAAESVVVGNVATADWTSALVGVDFVVHAAARAHVVRDSDSNSRIYFATNVEGTTRIAQAAVAAGVRRLVYLSSVKVNGEENERSPYKPSDAPQPRGVYGQSKWLAEKSLLEIAANTAMDAVIVRPPIVYGPGVRANFLRLMRWVDKGWPLPLGAIDNRRSLVSIWNLCDLLVLLLQSPAAPAKIWMVSDGEDLSTPDLIRRIAEAMGRRARLLSVPVVVLRALGKASARSDEVARLCGSLRLDVSRTLDELGWSPPLTVDQGISRTVKWYLSEHRSHRAR